MTSWRRKTSCRTSLWLKYTCIDVEPYNSISNRICIRVVTFDLRIIYVKTFTSDRRKCLYKHNGSTCIATSAKIQMKYSSARKSSALWFIIMKYWIELNQLHHFFMKNIGRMSFMCELCTYTCWKCNLYVLLILIRCILNHQTTDLIKGCCLCTLKGFDRW